MPLPKSKVRVEELIGRSGRRSFHIKANKDNIDIEKRTIKNLSISSETSEVVRYDWLEGRYYREVLLHGAENVDLSRLEAGANLFLDHDYKTENAIAVIEGSRLDSGEKKVRIDTRFSKKEKAQVTLDDIDDGILGNVSVGYEILEAREAEGEDAEGVATIEITRWQPFEASIVGIPADTNVGIGRSKEVIKEPKNIEVKERVMPEPITDPVKTAPPVDIDAIRAASLKQGQDEEAERVRELSAVGAAHLDKKDVQALVRKHIKERTPFDKAMQDIMVNGFKAREADPKTDGDNLDLSPKDVREYSFSKLILDSSDGKFRDSSYNSHELECSRAVAKRTGKDPKGIFIPMDVRDSHIQMSDVEFRQYQRAKAARLGSGQRDLSAGVDAAGGYLVGTDHLGASFIDIFTNALKVFSLGVRVLPGLMGDVAIPTKLTTGISYWLATEGADVTQSDMTFGTKTMTPKTLGAMTEYTRQLLLQSNPAVDQLVKEDLALVNAQAIDLAVLLGSGAAGQPTGIINTSGVNVVVAGDPDGAAATRADIVGMETEIANDNALVGTPVYLTNSKVRGALKLVDLGTDTGNYVWTDNGTMNGYRAEVSNQVPGNLVKGASGTTLSAIFLGIWSQAVLGMWGGFDVLTDPYTNSASGTIRVRTLQSVDVLVRQPTAFCYMNDVVA